MSDKSLRASDFVHLHNHTQYSLLDGLTKIPALIDKAKALGMEAIAITDHGTLSGVIEFYKVAKSNGIKPIIGIETYVAPRSHKDKDVTKDKNPYHLTILAMNNTGYQNLMKLSTLANLDGYYYRPRVDRELLQEFNEGLIVLSGCIGGEVSDSLRNDQYDKAAKAAKWYKKVFGDRYYLEVQDHGHKDHTSMWDEQVAVTELTLKLSKELDIPCVVTCDAHYLNQADQEAHEILLCVQTGSYLSDENRMSLKDFELHVTNPKDIIGRWGKAHPQLITNTREIADRCDVEIDLGKILIPKFSVPRGQTEKSHLQTLVYRGLAWRYGGISEQDAAKLSEEEIKKNLPIDIIARAGYELNVINEMRFNGYFLIIADFVNWGKDRGIVFGPGRGSAAGSIIAYALKITELDPLKYDLLFERFLNPDRISMPDIDIDIQDSRRDEVINYCIEKYGEGRVANIVTFGKMAARNAVRDVSRVLQVPYAEADRLAKMIPPPVQGRHIPLATSLQESSELKKEYKNNEQSKRVFDLAIQLEGTIRSHGVHAAGVVIAPDDIVNYAPLEMAQKGVVSTQYSMGPIEDIGLLKIDFLGLSNLTIIKNALRIIKRVYKADIDISTIPLDDVKTFDLFRKGDTTGVFQLESSGMKRYLKDLKPTVFEDIVAMVALYRPGPLTAGITDRFIARKNGLEDVIFDHELMEPALKNTYGVMVYQEQFMQIVKDMCGFSGGQADTLRKAVGKKNRELMAQLKDSVVKGAASKGVKQNIAEKFWADLEGFADYAFNKSHAACYGLIAYQTAYLKAHYPAAFMAALMTSDYDNTDRLAIEINECNHMGIKVLPPDVNESFVEFAVVPGKQEIRFSMAAIKNVGTGAVEEIIRAREANGHFKSLEEFMGCINTRLANRKTIESLIKAGALDRYSDRARLLNNLDNILQYASRLQKQNHIGQTDLFGSEVSEGDHSHSGLVLSNEGPDFSSNEQIKWERELLGVYLSHNPLEEFSEIISAIGEPLVNLSKYPDGHEITIAGVIQDVKEITTKNGQKMAFIKISDLTTEIEAVIFPKVFQSSSELFDRDKVVKLKGKLSKRGPNNNADEAKLIVNTIKEITAKTKIPTKVDSQKIEDTPIEQNEKPKRIFIRINDSREQKQLMNIKEIVDENSGDTEVVLVMGLDESKQAIKLPVKSNASEKVLSKLYGVVGESNVRLN